MHQLLVIPTYTRFGKKENVNILYVLCILAYKMNKYQHTSMVTCLFGAFQRTHILFLSEQKHIDWACVLRRFNDRDELSRLSVQQNRHMHCNVLQNTGCMVSPCVCASWASLTDTASGLIVARHQPQRDSYKSRNPDFVVDRHPDISTTRQLTQVPGHILPGEPRVRCTQLPLRWIQTRRRSPSRRWCIP